MEAGASVWLKDINGTQAWLSATVTAKSDSSVTVRVDSSNEERIIKLENESDDIAEVKLQNSVLESEAENLINLPYLHEPAILHCLELRYARSEIYTYTGPILIAMNPFKKVMLYTTQILEMYYNRGLLASQGIDSASSGPLPPHVYAIADAAYRNMMTTVNATRAAKDASSHLADQAILISGESGAGKTESTKIVLKYLTTVGNAKGGVDVDEGSVMDKVLQSNPILEAFGNSKTIRNDNSSRFGKFIELNFNRRGHLIGGQIETYLLEKVRIPSQQVGERGFHIFYQLCAGGTEDERKRWKLLPIEEFKYSNQGQVYKLAFVDDVEEFNMMKKALKTLNFPADDQVSLLNAVAGILHLGQLEFEADKSDEGSLVSQNPAVQKSLEAAVSLFAVPQADIVKALTTRTIVTRGESYVKKLTAVQASDARDAMAKAIYGKLFDWLVTTINKSLCVSDAKDIRAEIGVLDIFGFECFQHNSFEQLCINYTNETLQQQFNRFVFKFEQEEYTREKIQWSFISFPDNQDCLDLIEDRKVGLLSMLDDECKGVSGNDNKFADNLYRSFCNHERFKERFTASKSQVSAKKFCINHYAGPVVYSVATFVEKNKDELPKETASLFEKSSTRLLTTLFTIEGLSTSAAPSATNTPERGTRPGSTTTPQGASSMASSTIGTQFRVQLHQLMKKIESTKPHYIRCLKPNDQNKPDSFHRMRITEQLRYGGVLEAVRVARSGFPVRLFHADFFSRYRALANPFHPDNALLPWTLDGKNKTADPKPLCERLLTLLWDEGVPEAASAVKPSRRQSRMFEMALWKGKLTESARESVQLGLTKVFLRKQAHDLLEARRSRRLVAAVRKIQANYRRYSVQKWYFRVRRSILRLQTIMRGLLARRKAHHLRTLRASVLIQKVFRGFRGFMRYQDFRWSVIRSQSLLRGKIARKAYFNMREIFYCVRLQRMVRGIISARKYRLSIRRIVRIQCLYRVRCACRLFKKLKVEAKDLGKLKQSNEQMKAEIELLRKKAAEEADRMMKIMQEKAANDQKAAMNDMTKELSNEKEVSASLRALLHDAELKIKELEKEVEKLKASPQRRPSREIRAGDFSLPVSPNLGTAGSSLPPRGKLGESNASLTSLGSSGNITKDYENLAELYEKESKLWSQKIAESDKMSSKLYEVSELNAKIEQDNRDLQAEVNRLRSLLMDQGGIGQKQASRRASTIRPSSVRMEITRTVSSERSISTEKSPVDAKSAASMLFRSASPSTTGAGAVLKDEKFFEDDNEGDDDLDLVSPRGSAASLNSTAVKNAVSGVAVTPASANPETSAEAFATFQKNLELWKNKLKQGFNASFWDGRRYNAKLVKFDGNIRLSADGQLTINKTQASFKALFGIGGAEKSPIAPIAISDLIEIVAISPEMMKLYSLDKGEDTLMVAILSNQPASPLGGGYERITLMKVATVNERQTLFNTVRNIMLGGIADEDAATQVVHKPRRLSARESILMAKADQAKAAAEAAIAAAAGLDEKPRPAKRNSGTAGDEDTRGRRASLKQVEETEMKKVAELQNQLMVEQTNHHKLVVQVMSMSNDLNEKDKLLIASKKREETLQQLLSNREKIFEQDASARVQLGQKMQQLFIEKEDAIEQMEHYKELYERMQAEFAKVASKDSSDDLVLK